MKLKIIQNKGCIYFPEEIQEKYNLNEEIKICHGKLTSRAIIKSTKEELAISQDLADLLKIKEVDYDFKIINSEMIILGPVVGILAKRNFSALTLKYLSRMERFAINCTKGLLIVFSLDKIKDSFVRGYYFNPEKNKFEEAELPFPLSVYRRIGLSLFEKNMLQSIIGKSYFNSHFLNKYEVYKLLSQFEDLKAHIPYTILYKNPSDLFEMIDKFKIIYAKPILGLQGRKVYKISKEEGYIKLRFREEGLNKIAIINIHQADVIDEYIKSGNFILQQGIDLIQYEGRSLDLRCIMTKDRSNTWILNGIVVRVAPQGSIVTNVSSGGGAYMFEDFCINNMGFSDVYTFLLKEKIDIFCRRICDCLDNLGYNMGYLGIDIGVDKYHNVFLIEINSRDPDATIALDAQNTLLYYDIKANIVDYLNYLSGFGDG
ncbi:YheC/YheD family protein [Caloramator sp. CAR-1]|uniref:YheC/YheD family endospore coat-associated protein n=1 Tax=Caloramator sp. CAR-1 TaxID=3062777 RepID=UPI0026E460B6|nr:YheC/YheD family protein [Caloramator sp. CAR-1]MDO6353911.1 YheC/YheD family protein [Caloramator sp. CAR-1]